MAEVDEVRIQEGPVVCLSDEDADQRLRQLENGLHHIEAILPSMVREVERLRAGLNGGAA
jgi:hypothetical protein